MSKEIALFFFYQSFGGGSTSFTVHLFRGFELAGFRPRIYRVRARMEGKDRSFAKYEGVTYQNIDVEHAIKIVKHTPSLMTGACNSKYLCRPDLIHLLIKEGMRVVVHDPNEFKAYDYLTEKRVDDPFCIRPTMKKFFPNCIFVPHPYVRRYGNGMGSSREWTAVSVARVTHVKRSEIILEANRQLPDDLKVILRGAENRFYIFHKIRKLYPEYVQGSTGFPLVWHASAEECRKAYFAVDFTKFPHDGGGSQYSFMEAWDAGSVNIIHKDWLRYPGEMRDTINCLTVRGSKSLTRLLKLWKSSSTFRDECREIAERSYLHLDRVHDSADVARIYASELGA